MSLHRLSTFRSRSSTEYYENTEIKFRTRSNVSSLSDVFVDDEDDVEYNVRNKNDVKNNDVGNNYDVGDNDDNNYDVNLADVIADHDVVIDEDDGITRMSDGIAEETGTECLDSMENCKYSTKNFHHLAKSEFSVVSSLN